jgi:hypothetical protein
MIHRITYNINHLEADIAEGLHLEDIEEQLLVDTGIDLEHLGRLEDNLVLPEEERLGNLVVLLEEEHLGNLVPLDKQEVVRDRQVDIKLQDKARVGDNLLELAVDIVAYRAILEDKPAVEDKTLGSQEEDIELAVIVDNQILQHQLEVPLNSLVVA